MGNKDNLRRRQQQPPIRFSVSIIVSEKTFMVTGTTTQEQLSKNITDIDIAEVTFFTR